MSDPYRDSSSTSLLACPRCGEQMPPGNLRACGSGCGLWVTAETAQTVLFPEERRASRLTSWARELAGCPMCGKRMTLCGLDMTLFQGCEGHGFWIDREIVTQTALGRPTNQPLLADARARARAFHDELTREEREAREAEEKRALERRLSERTEREVREDRERAERRAAATRAAVLEPYVTAIHQAVGHARDSTQLAELLERYDNELAALRTRVDELERQLALRP